MIVENQIFVYVYEDPEDVENETKDEHEQYYDIGKTKDIESLDADTYVALGFFLLGFVTIVSLITLYFYLTGER
jgi:hypothetical protein